MQLSLEQAMLLRGALMWRKGFSSSARDLLNANPVVVCLVFVLF